MERAALGSGLIQHDGFAIRLSTSVDLICSSDLDTTRAPSMLTETYINRPSQLMLRFNMHSDAGHYLHSPHQPSIELVLINDQNTLKRKKARHRIDEDVPAYDIRAPAGYPTQQIGLVCFEVEVEGSAGEDDGCQKVLKHEEASTTPEGDVELSSPLLQPVAWHDTTIIKQEAGSELEEGLSSSVAWPSTEDRQFSISSPALTMLSSSPVIGPTMTCRSMDLGSVDQLQHALPALLQLAIHNNTSKQDYIQSDDFMTLSELAPSCFMPGFIEELAGRAPLMSRIANNLAAFSPVDANTIEHSLWNTTVYHLTTKYSKNRLPSLPAHTTSIHRPLGTDPLIESDSESDGILYSSDDSLDDLLA